MRIWFILFCSLLLQVSACTPRPVNQSDGSASGLVRSAFVTEAEILSILSYLTHDSLNGRSAGTIENRQVTQYLADYFSSIGLKPLLDEHFINTFYTNDNDTGYSISNVIGYLRGSSKPDEYILVSAHFDHVVSGFYNQVDKIYNGANDNASGTTAMMMLAKHYALTETNKRSIIFCAFNGEESGLLGSQDLAQKLPAGKIVAGINLEMLGVPQYGKRSLMVTGMKKSNLAGIMRSNLKGTGIRLLNEKGDLFERSDNYPFASKGVPAHSIMASDDRDRCYHQGCDELKRIDIRNMADLTNAIIVAISTIVEGTDTPGRIVLK
ncbi:M28 family metallopeptidase [Flavihumibacter stibioxidans]|uniref:Peptidase M28 domain-containing protein n=1 Tax=Flavihumibacter stibioxidans TaxID=1834163 RepID=A0ABR7MDS6_9BACT|nr:M28 family peptidase [Flavihumibacter stibioxidans]MBC6493190.1 hypothetical protein [Flavihumibacter stibioxidans]